MAEHRNVQRIRHAYAALAAGNFDDVFRFMAPDVVFHLNGSGPLSGDHTGVGEVTSALGGLLELTAGDLHLNVGAVYADDHHAVVQIRETASRPDGATLDIDEVHLLAINSDGCITDLWDLPSDPAAHNRFFDGQ